MAKKPAQIKGVPEDASTKLKRWLKSEYNDEEKFTSNLVQLLFTFFYIVLRTCY